MAWIRPEVHKAVTDNDLNSVIFQDPLSETTRRTKRNLLLASFVAILIAVLGLEISGALGFRTKSPFGNDLAQGFACLVVAYTLVSFIYQAFIDYSAWKFQRERQETEPYLELIRMIEGRISVTGEQIHNATSRLSGVTANLDQNQQWRNELSKDVTSALGQSRAIERDLSEFISEVRPLLGRWKLTMKKMDHLKARLRVRFVSLWVWEIILPLSLGSLAIAKTMDGVAPVLQKIIVP